MTAQFSDSSRHKAGLKVFFLKAGRWLRRPGPMHAWIAVSSLAVSGCVTQEYVRSFTYEYTDQQNRLAAERRAIQDIHDACYFSGAQYPELVGPPQIVSEDGSTGKQFRVTQSFYCVGTIGGP